jgi:hypothetical protein
VCMFAHDATVLIHCAATIMNEEGQSVLPPRLKKEMRLSVWSHLFFQVTVQVL